MENTNSSQRVPWRWESGEWGSKMGFRMGSSQRFCIATLMAVLRVPPGRDAGRLSGAVYRPSGKPAGWGAKFGARASFVPLSRWNAMSRGAQLLGAFFHPKSGLGDGLLRRPGNTEGGPERMVSPLPAANVAKDRPPEP